MAPASRLRRIGIEIDGRITAGRILFGPDIAEPILGLTVLESLGLVVDPKRRKLRRLPVIALK